MVPAFSLPGAIKFNDAIAAGRRLKLTKPDIKHDDVAFLQYTGGTTGVSKGATLLHRNIIANVLQNEAWLQPALKKGKQVERMTIVTALPLYHIFALTACCLLGMRIGAMCLLIPNPRDIPGFIKELGEVRVPHAAGREHALQRAAQQPGVRQARLHAAEGRQRRRHGRAAGGGRAVLQAHRRARSSRATACRRPRRR